MKHVPPTLVAAFEATCYRIRLGDSWQDTFVGQRCPALALWLQKHGYPAASLVSARNPNGLPLAEDENLRREHDLRRRLRTLGLTALPAMGVALDGRFVEPSLWVPGLAGPPCRRLMQDFDQLAWVEYDASGLARLCWNYVEEEGDRCG